jgi:2-dehydro-3-deoxy-D-arabinonate dehydratase
MALCRFVNRSSSKETPRWGWLRNGRVYSLDDALVSCIFSSPYDSGLHALAEVDGPSLGVAEAAFAAPLVEGQEVWAAGVTYESSKFARMAESTEGGDFYAKVYVADRPELFFKATPRRTVGPGEPVRIRHDSAWNVPEPELAVVIAATGHILGFTIGNDMSSRDIEGENPLYLPQAKVYTGSCALGPVIVPADSLDPHTLDITLTILRDGQTAYRGETSTTRMRRRVEDLAGWLFRENEFPHGVVLLTGTGLIPPDDFTLRQGDEIDIEIDKIGTLRNVVA